jgi:hypothetical protein
MMAAIVEHLSGVADVYALDPLEIAAWRGRSLRNDKPPPVTEIGFCKR